MGIVALTLAQTHWAFAIKLDCHVSIQKYKSKPLTQSSRKRNTTLGAPYTNQTRSSYFRKTSILKTNKSNSQAFLSFFSIFTTLGLKRNLAFWMAWKLIGLQYQQTERKRTLPVNRSGNDSHPWFNKNKIWKGTALLETMPLIKVKPLRKLLSSPIKWKKMQLRGSLQNKFSWS